MTIPAEASVFERKGAIATQNCPDSRVLLEKAREHRKAGLFSEAERVCRCLLSAAPDDVEILQESAIIAEAIGDSSKAVEHLHRCLVLEPDSPQIHNTFGLLLCGLGRATAALELLDAAISLDPGYADAHCNRGRALRMLGRMDDAMDSWQKALKAHPRHSFSKYCIGECLLHYGRPHEALLPLREVIQLDPGLADAYLCLTTALQRIGEVEEALRISRQALHLRPTWPTCHSNYGSMLSTHGFIDQAVRSLRRAIELDPANPLPRKNLAYAYLKGGDFERGWAEHEWRHYYDGDAHVRKDWRHPEWNGCSLNGRTIVVSAEQGLGDTIQFVRFLPLLSLRGATIVVECQARLVPLLRNTPELGVIVSRDERLPPFDVHAALMSLPAILNITAETIPAAVPYLRSPPSRGRDRIMNGHAYRIGIAWQGNKEWESDPLRSISLCFFGPLGALPGVTLVSLQKFDGSEQLREVSFPIEPLGEDADAAGAFLDTAAMMMELDLVVTCDTAIAHLAGALGRPVWVALSKCADWRWMLDRSDSPWYPTMRLFRQKKLGEWGPVFEEMARTVRRELLATRPTGLAPSAVA